MIAEGALMSSLIFEKGSDKTCICQVNAVGRITRRKSTNSDGSDAIQHRLEVFDLLSHFYT